VRGLVLLLALLLPAAAPRPRTVTVRLDTALGPITIALDLAHAPITAGNFLAYVDEKRFVGQTFYRAARSRRDPRIGLVQGGTNHVAVRNRFPIAHEPTIRTGLRHVDGTVSMARNQPGTASGDFFIVVGGASYLDYRSPAQPGYAAFGKVVGGMDVVRRIMALPTYPGGFSQATVGQSLRTPVRITATRRVG
jgi:peptidyl-prolyl cis-trans isomerase A (cyclophilin A)